jgi:hypothetical protein
MVSFQPPNTLFPLVLTLVKIHFSENPAGVAADRDHDPSQLTFFLSPLFIFIFIFSSFNAVTMLGLFFL